MRRYATGAARIHRYALLACFVVASACASVPELWPWFVVAALGGAIISVVGYRASGLSTSEVLLWALVFRLLFLPLLPTLSDDGFRYVWDGLLQLNGLNPYLFRPLEVPISTLQDSALLERLNSANYYSVYPPVSQVIFATGGLAGDWGWAASFMAIKLAMVGFETAGMFLLARLVSARSLLLYAWNPVVIIETAGQAHPEAILASSLVVIVWAFRRNRPTAAAVSLAVAVWVKLYPILLLPFLLRRIGYRHVLSFLAASALIVLPFYRPNVISNTLESLGLYTSLFEFYAGPYLALKWLAYEYIGGSGIEEALGKGLRWILIASLPAIYWLDVSRSWTFARASLVVIGLFLALATTVHPWYFVGLLALLPFLERPSLGWIWLSLLSVATYLLYSHNVYWIVVWIGWTGWGILLVAQSIPWSRVLDGVLRKRARMKWTLLRSLEPVITADSKVLDVGAAEGYVGECVFRETGAEVALCDVWPGNRTDLAFRLILEDRLPYASNSYDVALLVFVLHHARDDESLLLETARVTRRHVVVVESVYRNTAERATLLFLDRLANRIRSRGEMQGQNANLLHRTAEDWRRMFERLGFQIERERHVGRFPHRVAAYRLRVPASNEWQVDEDPSAGNSTEAGLNN